MHYKYSEEELQASLRSEVNPFPLHSEWVDRDIKVGDIDEDVRVLAVTSWLLPALLNAPSFISLVGVCLLYPACGRTILQHSSRLFLLV